MIHQLSKIKNQRNPKQKKVYQLKKHFEVNYFTKKNSAIVYQELYEGMYQP